MAPDKRQLVIRPRAQDDLEGIWLHTAENWSTGQAERYLEQIGERMEQLALQPGLARPYERIPGIFKLSAGSHVLFCQIDPETVEIVRVLHAAQDYERHLTASE